MQDFIDNLTPQNNIIPVIGMKATICIGSDLSPAEVTRVAPDGKTCWIKEVKSRRVSIFDQDGTAAYEYDAATSDTEEIRITWTIGGWRRASGGSTVWLNRQERYCDPHFWDKKEIWNKRSQIQ